MYSRPSVSSAAAREVAVRARQTLSIMHRWGYAPTLEVLAADLIGGPASLGDLKESAEASSDVRIRESFAYLRGHEGLVEKSKRRLETNRLLNGRARKIANEFARELASLCPFVECIALSGSVASGGYGPGDDIDFDLFVRDGTKYIVYAVSLLLGFRTSLRHRREYGLRKLICINVLWTRTETEPFTRQDHDLAFELLHCTPTFGAARFQEAVDANRWVLEYFPQIQRRPLAREPIRRPNRLSRALEWMAKHRHLLALIEAVCRQTTFVAYSLIHWARKADPEAAARFEFLRRAKYPYEVFQD